MWMRVLFRAGSCVRVAIESLARLHEYVIISGFHWKFINEHLAMRRPLMWFDNLWFWFYVCVCVCVCDASACALFWINAPIATHQMVTGQSFLLCFVRFCKKFAVKSGNLLINSRNDAGEERERERDRRRRSFVLIHSATWSIYTWSLTLFTDKYKWFWLLLSFSLDFFLLDMKRLRAWIMMITVYTILIVVTSKVEHIDGRQIYRWFDFE